MKRLLIAVLFVTCATAQMLKSPTGPNPASGGVGGASTLTTAGDIPQVSAVPGVLEVSRLNCALGVCTLEAAAGGPSTLIVKASVDQGTTDLVQVKNASGGLLGLWGYSGNLEIGTTVAGGRRTINGIYVDRGELATNANTAIGENTLSHIAVGTGGVGGVDFTWDGTLLAANTQGTTNTAVGQHALQWLAKGSDNTAVGAQALRDLTQGYYNVGVGHYSLGLTTKGWKNTAVGTFSLNNNLIGNNNSALGMSALQYNVSGHRNLALGERAQLLNLSGSKNVAIGGASLYNSRTANYNTSVGYGALMDLASTDGVITAFDDYSGTVAGTVRATSATHGRVGVVALTIAGTLNYDGDYNCTVIDADTFYFTKAFVENETTGTWALTSQNSANNTAVGYNTGIGITYGSGNTILGANVAGLTNSLTNNIILAIGTGAIKARFDGTNWAFSGGGSFSGDLITTGGTQTQTLAYPGMYLNPDAVTAQMTVENAGGVEGGLFAHTGGTLYLGSWSNHPIAIRTNNADVITIATTGATVFASTVDSAGFKVGASVGGDYTLSCAGGQAIKTLTVVKGIVTAATCNIP